MSGSDAASHSLPLRNCYWVVPGLLLAGEHPNGPTRDKTKDRLKKLLDAGIESFVDLTKPTELLRYDTFLPFYVEYTRKSIKDHGIPTARSQMVEILEHIANSMRAGRPVYVHCRAGIGRTGTVVGCLLAERGMQGQATIDELNRLWQQCRRSRSWPFIPETDAQAHYVREWQPSLDGGFELSSLATAVATVGSMSAAGGVRGSVAPGAGVGSRPGSSAATVGSRTGTARVAGTGSSAAGGSSTGAVEPAVAGAPGPAVDRRAGAGFPRVGRGANGATGVGLRAAAEQARAAVARGEVQVKAPPAPASTAGPAAAPTTARGRSVSTDTTAPPRVEIPAPGTASSRAAAPVEFERGEIAPSVRAEIAEAIAGRAPSSLSSGASTGLAPSQGTASPNGAEEAPWAVSAPTSISDTVKSRIPAQPSAAGPRTAAAAEPPTPARGSAAEEQMAAARAAVSSELTAARGAAAKEQPIERRAAGIDPPAPGRISAAAEQIAHARAAVASEVSAMEGAAAKEQPVEPPAAGRNSAAAEQMAAARAAVASELSATRSAAAMEPPATARSSDAVQSGAAARAVPPPVEQSADSDPLLDPETIAAARGLRERFLGTMFGLAVGDAVAAATQFRRPGTFSPIGDMLGGGPFDLPRGAWSDDTAMALCLAESLLERDGFDARDQVQRYSRWQQDGYLTSTGQCVGITANTARSLALAKWRRGMVFPGSHDPEQLDPEPLSRIASIALFYFASLESTQQQAVDSSRITCQAPAVLEACRRLSRALNAALAGQPRAKILAEGGPINEATVQANNTAAAALNAALWAFSSTDNFRDAVLRAANVGGNSDVVATVVGQLAGAHYGASAIPASWRNGLIQKDLIEGIADRLLAHALVSLSS